MHYGERESARQYFEKRLTALVNTFKQHHNDYMRHDYSEAQTRIDFIDPLFQALGWDVNNSSGLARNEREVVVEHSKTCGRVDYAFRNDGHEIFYVEAKAPHVSLDNIEVVMQAKSYAWHSSGVFICAITDFEEFRLYDATSKPDSKHLNAGLIFSYRYTDYLKPKALNDLWLLSHDSIKEHSIDRLLKKSSVQARQKIPVGQAFLEDLTRWREKLAKAVFKTNPNLSPVELNSIVQVFLDRLVFIRICEDHQIMPQNQLKDVAENWKYSGKRISITANINALFHDVNYRLNGEIFKPNKVEKIDFDKNTALVIDIINNLSI